MQGGGVGLAAEGACLASPPPALWGAGFSGGRRSVDNQVMVNGLRITCLFGRSRRRNGVEYLVYEPRVPYSHVK